MNTKQLKLGVTGLVTVMLVFIGLMDVSAQGNADATANSSRAVLAAAVQGDAEEVERLLAGGARFTDDELRAYLDGGMSLYLARDDVNYRDMEELYSEMHYGWEDLAEVPLALRARAGLSDTAQIDRSPAAVRRVLPLLIAARNGPNGKHVDGTPYLVSAAYGGVAMESLLALGANPDVTMADGTPLLIWALQQSQHTESLGLGGGYSDMLLIGVDPDPLALPLIKAGADVQATAPDGTTAIQAVLRERHIAYTPFHSLAALVRRGARAETVFGDTPVRTAMEDHPAMAVALIAGGLRDNSLKQDELNHLLAAACVFGFGETIAPLVDQGADPLATVEMRAEMPLDLERVRYLSWQEGQTFFQEPDVVAWAVLGGTVEPLLAAIGEAQQETLNERVVSGLNAIVTYRPVEAARLVETLGLDLGSIDEDVATRVLVEACRLAPPAMVAALIDAGADPRRPDVFGETPLYAAMVANRTDVMKLLIERGAYIDCIVPGPGVTVRQCVTTAQDTDMQALIEAELSRRPLRQPAILQGFVAADAVDQTALWPLPGWHITMSDGGTGWVARDGRACTGAEPVPAMDAWLVRREGHWQLVRDGELLFDRAVRHPEAGTWIARREDRWYLLAPDGRELLSGFAEMRPTPERVELVLVRDKAGWGAVDGYGQTVIATGLADPATVFTSLAGRAESRFRDADALPPAVVAAVQWLVCEVTAAEEAGTDPAAARARVLKSMTNARGPGVALQILDLTVGLGEAEALEPWLVSLGWEALPDGAPERAAARRALDAVLDDPDGRKVGEALGTWFEQLHAVRLPGEDDATVTQRKTELLLELRQNRDLRFYLDLLLTIDSRSMELAKEILPPNDRSKIKEMARTIVKEWNDQRNELTPEEAAAVHRRWRSEKLLRNHYPELRAHLAEHEPRGLLLELPLGPDRSVRAVVPVADPDATGRVLFLDATGTLYDRKAYTLAVVEGLIAAKSEDEYRRVSEAAEALAELDGPHAARMRDLAGLADLLRAADLWLGPRLHARNTSRQNLRSSINYLRKAVAEHQERLGEPDTPVGELFAACLSVFAEGPEIDVSERLERAPLPEIGLDRTAVEALLARSRYFAGRPASLSKAIGIQERRWQQEDRQRMAEIRQRLRQQRAQREEQARLARQEAERQEQRRRIFAEVEAQARQSYSGTTSDGWAEWEAKLDRSLGSENRAAWRDYVLHDSYTWRITD